MLKGGLTESAARMGEHMMRQMRKWPGRIASMGDVRGLASMIGIELVRDRATKERAPELRGRMVERDFECGLLVLGAGENTVRLCPPLIVSRDQADLARDVIEAACQEQRT